MNDDHLEDSIFGADDEPLPSRAEVRAAAPRPPRRTGRKWLVLLLTLGLVGGAGFAAWPTVKSTVESLTGLSKSTDTDFPGPGSGSVKVTVKKGQTGEDIASTLKAAGVVKTRTAYLEASKADPEGAAKIQAGSYLLKKGMKGADAFALLLDPASRAPGVTVREGLWAVEVYPILSKATGVPVKNYVAAAKNPAAIGLPAEAKGNVEGWLFPSTYDFAEGMPADAQLKAMVALTVKELTAQNVARDAWENTLILASLVEAEAKLDVDRPKIARVFLNRLANIGQSPTYGLIESDASISYGAKDRRPFPTDAQRQDRSNPYNRRFAPGLPPGPISNPGKKSIDAAARPAAGDWLFFVAVNLVSGETKYAATLSGHNANVAELQKWCKANPGNGC